MWPSIAAQWWPRGPIPKTHELSRAHGSEAVDAEIGFGILGGALAGAAIANSYYGYPYSYGYGYPYGYYGDGYAPYYGYGYGY